MIIPETDEIFENDQKYITFMTILATMEQFGVGAVRSSCETIFKNHSNDVDIMKAFVVAVNHCLWNAFNEHGDCELARTYNELWAKYDRYALDHFKDEELSRYVAYTD